MTRVPRSVVEATARLMGPSSAAAKALAKADAQYGETKFFSKGGVIVVRGYAVEFN